MIAVFQSAVRGSDGEVDAGYLAMYVITAIILGAIPFMCMGVLLSMWLSPTHAFDVQALGVGIGSVCGGFGVVLGAVGIFRVGDKDKYAAPKAARTPE